jgi:HAD superfamily hydrolase (TIGR01458 family)
MARKVLLDIDGVLTVSWAPLPGAVETIAWLRSQELAFTLVTNTSSKSRREIAELLAASSMAVSNTQIVTAVTAAARYLEENFPGTPCLVVNDGDLSEDLTGVDFADASDAGVVLLGGAGPGTGYSEFNAVFRLALTGVPVVALHRNTRYQTRDGPSLDMGAFIAGLEAATATNIAIVGKPSATFFESALDGIRSSDAVMVGDDIESDVLGAQAVGITGVLVKTGKFRPSDLTSGAERPNHLIDGIAQLPALLVAMCDS